MQKKAKKANKEKFEYLIIILRTSKGIKVENPWSTGKRLLKKFENTDEGFKKAQVYADKKKLEILAKAFNFKSTNPNDETILDQIKRQSKNPVVFGWRIFLYELLEAIPNESLTTPQFGIWLCSLYGKPVFVWFDRMQKVLTEANKLTGEKYDFPKFEGMTTIIRQRQSYD